MCGGCRRFERLSPVLSALSRVANTRDVPSVAHMGATHFRSILLLITRHSAEQSFCDLNALEVKLRDLRPLPRERKGRSVGCCT
jgi:hypothetical protein